MSWIRRAPDVGPDAAVTPSAGSDGGPAYVQPTAAGGATVISLPSASTSPASQAIDELVAAQPKPARITGLMNAPELDAFFDANQYGFGRHHGSRYRSLEALDRGLEAVVAEFQRIVACLAERRQAKIDRLELARQEVGALSPSMAAQLGLAIEQTRRELNVLTEQLAFAEQRRGWVLDALNRYRLGFDRGVREALDYELLGA
jgi:hypothetical protein